MHLQIPHPRPSLARSLAVLIIGAMGIGFAPIFVRVSDVGVDATGFWRLALALPPLMLWTFVSRSTLAAPRRRSEWFFILLGGACFAGDLAIWHTSIHMTSVANATLETNLSAILVPLFAWLFLRQKIGGAFLAALALALAGVILLVGRNAHISPRTLRGDTLGTLSAFFYSGYLLSVKAARDRGAPTAIVMTISGLMTAATLLGLAWFSGEHLVPNTTHGWLVVFGLAVVSQLGGQVLIAYALIGLPAPLAAIALLVQPATATLAAWGFLGESLAPGQLAGGVVLTFGLWLAQRTVR